jgi:hypothetical protein
MRGFAVTFERGPCIRAMVRGFNARPGRRKVGAMLGGVAGMKGTAFADRQWPARRCRRLSSMDRAPNWVKRSLQNSVPVVSS